MSLAAETQSGNDKYTVADAAGKLTGALAAHRRSTAFRRSQNKDLQQQQQQQLKGKTLKNFPT